MPHHVTDQWSISGSNGQAILGNVDIPIEAAKGVFIICHGFKGYKDYGLFPLLAYHAAAQGLIAHRFNFSHSGMTNHIEHFEHPDLFQQDTWSRQLYDLEAVIDHIRTGRLPGRHLPIILFGHSRGGVTAVLTGAVIDQPVQGIISAAAPHSANYLSEYEKELMRKQGYLESPSSRTGQMLRIGRQWLDEMEADPDRYNPVLAMGKIDCPILIIHGQDDSTVPVESARILHEAAGEKSQQKIINNASHTFNAPNPLPLDVQPPPQTRELIDTTLAFADYICHAHLT